MRSRLITLLVLLITVSLLANVEAAPLEGCGGGAYKLDNWTEGETERSMNWSEIKWFICPTSEVEKASAFIKAGDDIHTPNGCYGFEWDQSGFRVWEKGPTNPPCEDISYVIVMWECKCPATVCTETNAFIDHLTKVVTGNGSGQGDEWRVVKTSTNEVMDNGNGQTANYELVGDYDTEYQLQFKFFYSDWTTEGCKFSFNVIWLPIIKARVQTGLTP